MQPKTPTERLVAVSNTSAGLLHASSMAEAIQVIGRFRAVMSGPRESERSAYMKIQEQIAAIQTKGILARIAQMPKLKALENEISQFELEEKWVDEYSNTVVTTGKNYLLDNGMAGSAYTAAFYMGLISSTSYAAGVVAGDTMSSHTGWTEDANYSQANRPTAAWSAASAGSKALSSSLTFTMNATTTIKGSFLSTNNTKSGTTGVLFSGGLFSGGDQPAVSGNTLTVGYTLSL